MATTTNNKGRSAVSPTAMANVIAEALKKQSMRPAERSLVLAALVRKLADMQGCGAAEIMAKLHTILELDQLDKHHLIILTRNVLEIDAELAEELGMDYSMLSVRCTSMAKAGYLRCIGGGANRHTRTRYTKKRYQVTAAGKERLALVQSVTE